jgi:RES domain
VSDSAETDPRHELIFLRSFIHEVSAPIDREDRAHVDYVPTQVVAEYFRSIALEDGRRVDGIRYASARRPRHACYALFAGQEQVVLSEEDVRRHYRSTQQDVHVTAHDAGWLRLVDSSERVVPNEPL